MVEPADFAFLFTDVEDSTRLWAEQTAAMDAALARHDEILLSSVERRHGTVFSHGGDGFGVAFADAGDALGAALDSQAVLAAEPWTGLDQPLRVRMGLHVGE